MSTIEPLETTRRSRKRILMPMVIIGLAILLGWWFPGQDTQQRTEIEHHVRVAIAHQCDDSSPRPHIQWALPIVEGVFGVAASYWCDRGVDLDGLSFSWGEGPAGTQLVLLTSSDGSTMQLLVSIEDNEGITISSVQHDPAGT